MTQTEDNMTQTKHDNMKQAHNMTQTCDNMTETTHDSMTQTTYDMT